MRKVIIIGGASAGLTSALYAARANLKPLVLEGSGSAGDLPPGGQLALTTLVENYPGFPQGIQGPEVMKAFRDQALRFGAEIVSENCTRADLRERPFLVEWESGSERAQALIIATGAAPRMLDLGKDRELLGRGVSTCATCDGAFFNGMEVAVVGGGDSAMEEATFLTRFATKISVIHRRDKLRASKIMQERARQNPKISFVWNSAVTDILTNERGLVRGVVLQNIVTSAETTLRCSGLFMGIGHVPNTQLFQGQIELDDLGYIVVKRFSETSVRGVFAAGDVVDHRYRQAVTAAGMGCQAAIDAERFLESEGL